MPEFGEILAKSIGTIPGWGTFLCLLLIAWKGMPAFIDAWEKRSSGIEARLQASIKSTLERYDIQLREADRHHQICIDEQQVLRDQLSECRSRLTEQDRLLATQNNTIASQTQMITEQAEQLKGLSISSIQLQTDLADRIRDKAS